MKKCFILQNSKYEKIIKIFLYLISIIFWFFVWDVVAEKIDKEIFLPKPLEVFDVIFTSLFKSNFLIPMFSATDLSSASLIELSSEILYIEKLNM